MKIIIKEIQLKNIATYENEKMKPNVINFCYGSNGSGKTILANLIGDYACLEDSKEDSKVLWYSDERIPVLTYNKNFVEKNFRENTNIAGIFTLGEESKDAHDFIEKQKGRIENAKSLLERHKGSEGKVLEEKNEIIARFKNNCWTIQQTYGERFKEALIGFRGSKDDFATKCLDEFYNNSVDIPASLTEIETLYSVAYSETKIEYPLFELFDFKEIKENESCTLLQERISGSSDSPIGTFIEYLQNSDWVKQGIKYAKLSNGKCPYCQQMLHKDIQKQIEDFFDESYERKIQKLEFFIQNYKSFTNNLLSTISNIIDNPISYLKYETLKNKFLLLESKIRLNKNILNEKINAPATRHKIQKLLPLIEEINKIIQQYNSIITQNNNVVRNQKEERKKCQNLIWKLFVYNLCEQIKQYNKDIKGRDKRIKNIQELSKKQKEHILNFEKSIREKEEKLTSVIPTSEAINGILLRFRFQGFKIIENHELKGTYKIVRPDGTDANKTLSEGEYNFITFLYFYHLVYGSHDKTGLASKKVIVIDDPISSLDSNVLFIISTLVKQMLLDCKDNKNGIIQMFILTHNVYFHKEITFLNSRENYPISKTSYWIIKKINNESEIVKYDKNPIKTSYELLWSGLKEDGCQDRATIFNTLRRILEYYFNIIGGIDYEKCMNQFEGEDKILCKALISCINDGPHFISDDFVMCFESDTIENYLRVFKLIFEKMEHGSHYKMMMAVR